MPLPRVSTPSSGDDSDADSETLFKSEDPRTISQMKRSRIDLDRRYVFLCPTFLSKHFDVLPHQAKDSALLVFRCSRSWVFQDPPQIRAARTKSRVKCWSVPRHRKPNARTRSGSPNRNKMGSALYHTEFPKEFLQWLLTKEKEGCVFWYKPERDLHKLSAFFEEKIDPVNEQPYRPLLLDPQWWRVRFMAPSAKYCLNPNVVIAALAGAGIVSCPTAEGSPTHVVEHRDIDIPALQELIHQSNPTLEPIAKWPHAPSMRFIPRSPTGDTASSVRFFKGYIDQERKSGAEPGPRLFGQEHSRIDRWPEAPRERFDDLHRSWQLEDAVSTRRQALNLLPPLTSR